jgi:DNA invertase Pin-like site-specific DNA recombinase
MRGSAKFSGGDLMRKANRNGDGPAGAKRAVGYCRVSTDKQADEGVSLDAQREKIRAMAVVHGAALADVIVDAGESAKNLDRPGMVQLLELVRAGAVDLVIIAKLDRLTRSVRDLADLLELLLKHGVSLVSVAESLDTGSASGRLVLNIMCAVSQWEREAIGERTRDALAHKKANGEFVGNAPFGYQRDGARIRRDTAEQAVLRRMRELRAAGLTLRAVADQLNREGQRTRKGGPWAHQLIRNALAA